MCIFFTSFQFLCLIVIEKQDHKHQNIIGQGEIHQKDLTCWHKLFDRTNSPDHFIIWPIDRQICVNCQTTPVDSILPFLHIVYRKYCNYCKYSHILLCIIEIEIVKNVIKITSLYNFLVCYVFVCYSRQDEQCTLQNLI